MQVRIPPPLPEVKATFVVREGVKVGAGSGSYGSDELRSGGWVAMDPSDSSPLSSASPDPDREYDALGRCGGDEVR